MNNITILHILLSYSLKSPLLTPSSPIHISKSSFSYFSNHLLYSKYQSTIKNCIFRNFLSTSIKISNFDRYYQSQVFNSKLEARDDRLVIYFCVFQNCFASAGTGGGAIFISGGTIELNLTGFQNCYVTMGRSYGGAIYADCDSVIINSVCASDCYTLDYAQSFYILNRDSLLEYITIATCGLATSSFSSEAISVSGTVNVKNLNSTGNAVKNNAAGFWCSKTSLDSNFNIIYSTFVNNAGNSIFDISSGENDAVYSSNFVSNTAKSSVIFSYGARTKPIFRQCVFQSNSFRILIHANTANNIVSLENCYSNSQIWGNVTLNNCVVAVTATINNQFYKDGICNGNFQIPATTSIYTLTRTRNPNTNTAFVPTYSRTITSVISQIVPTKSPTISPNISAQPTSVITSVITSLYPLPTPSCPACNCPECVAKKDTRKLIAIIFCIVEAVIILILILFFILLIIYVYRLEKNQKPKEDDKSENQNSLDEESVEKNVENNDEDNSFFPTPHMPSPDESPSGARRRQYEKQLTPQIPRKMKKKNQPINETSPLIREKHGPVIVFSSSDSDTI